MTHQASRAYSLALAVVEEGGRNGLDDPFLATVVLFDTLVVDVGLVDDVSHIRLPFDLANRVGETEAGGRKFPEGGPVDLELHQNLAQSVLVDVVVPYVYRKDGFALNDSLADLYQLVAQGHVG